MSEPVSNPHTPQSVAELLGLHDEEFVRCAYLSILGRPADPGGFAEYLRQIRLGMDKRMLLVVIATSAEGRAIHADERLPGLPELIIQVDSEKNRSFFSRLMSRWMADALKPLSVQVEASGHRVALQIKTIQEQIDRLDAAVGTLSAADQSSHHDRLELSELRRMTLHARQIYFHLRDAAAKHSRTSV